MSNSLRIVMAQLNLTVGAIEKNLAKHLHSAAIARDELSADIIVFPELSLTGYSPEDLLLIPDFISQTNHALQTLTSKIQGIHCVVGHTLLKNRLLYNACSIIYNGKILATYAKQRLPNNSVFDECRYFTPGKKSCLLNIKGTMIGFVICEDLWKIQPVKKAAKKGAKVIISPNASPFEIDKHERRLAVLSKRAQQNNLPIVYVNQVGGQDDLVFDGGSMLINANGDMIQHAGFFKETLLAIDLDLNANKTIEYRHLPLPSQEERIYQALVLSVRDYVEKNKFPGVLVGLSGGIDSALTLTIAVDALGKDRVKAVLMPSRYTADISILDAKELAQRLSVEYEIISIENIYENFINTLADSFKNKKTDVTEENIQARCRGTLLMALSNKFGQLVLTTGNRSELAVGYCTLYGDMAGGFAVLKDVTKTEVFNLATYRNQLEFVIPQRTIDRPPSAELAEDQKDEDSLPPYSILDKILDLYLNQSKSESEIIALGFETESVRKVLSLIKRSEYKRKQSAIGPRINHKSFGRDWRFPITNGFTQ